MNTTGINKLLLGLVMATVSFNVSTAQRSTKIDKSRLLLDIEHLAAGIEEIHADPFRMLPEREFESKKRELARRVAGGQARVSLIDCYFLLQEFAACVQDGHTYVHFPNHCLPPETLFFPFSITILDGRVYLKEKWTKAETDIPVGAELIEVDHTPVENLYSESLKFFNSPLPHGKVNQFELFFHLYLSTYFDLHSPWHVEFNSGDGEKESDVEGVSGEILFPRLMGGQSYRVAELLLGEENIPILEIPSFAYGTRREYEDFIDGFFEEYREKAALIIDLRRNTGGTGTWGFYLLDHLTDKPYRIIDRFDIRVSDSFLGSPYRHKAGDKLRSARKGALIPSALETVRSPKSQGPRFKGRIFLLTSRRTFSAGVVTAAVFKHNRMGQVIGGETSGRERFCSDPINLELPHSGLWVSIPTAVFDLPGDTPDRGLVPDVQPEHTVRELRENRDKDLETVKRLLSLK